MKKTILPSAFCSSLLYSIRCQGVIIVQFLTSKPEKGKFRSFFCCCNIDNKKKAPDQPHSARFRPRLNGSVNLQRPVVCQCFGSSNSSNAILIPLPVGRRREPVGRRWEPVGRRRKQTPLKHPTKSLSTLEYTTTKLPSSLSHRA